MTLTKRTVHVIAGPTGTGKSDTAMALAAKHGAPIVVADRIQCFLDIPITSARLDSDPTTGVERHHLQDRKVIDGDYDPDLAARDLARLVDQLIERHPLVVVEGGSLSLLRRFAGSTHDYQLTADVLRIPDPDAYRQRLRARVERMMRPADGLPGMLEEFEKAWHHVEQRDFVASINGYEAIVQWCERHGYDPGSVTRVRGCERLQASMADAITDLHAFHGREQDDVFPDLFGASE